MKDDKLNGFDFTKFNTIYEKSVRDVMSFMSNSTFEKISRHNYGWKEELFDTHNYLDCSKIRFSKAVEMYLSGGGAFDDDFSHLDVGGFLAAFPLTLSRMGFNCTIVEKLSYYDSAFDNYYKFLSDEGISVLDHDFVLEQDVVFEKKYKLVTCLAVLEHLPHSPLILINNLKQACCTAGGKIVIEVPNIAYWPKRVNFLKGETVLPPIEHVLRSDIPFVGHHREYTVSEFKKLISFTGLKIKKLDTFNYTNWPKGNWKQKLLLEFPIKKFFSCREILIACCDP